MSLCLNDWDWSSLKNARLPCSKSHLFCMTASLFVEYSGFLGVFLHVTIRSSANRADNGGRYLPCVEDCDTLGPEVFKTPSILHSCTTV